MVPEAGAAADLQVADRLAVLEFEAEHLGRVPAGDLLELHRAGPLFQSFVSSATPIT